MFVAMRRRLRYRLLAISAIAAAAALAAPTGASAQAVTPAVCPSTFEVLHDDSIGKLILAKGAYTVTLLDPSALTCDEASDLLRQFLEDFDGRLQRPWVVNVPARSFTRGRGGSVGFSVTPAGTGGGGGGGGGGHHPIGTVCPGTFQVLHNDHIGSFALPKGQYLITLLAVGRITCARASSSFTRFLEDYDGVLPRPWFVDPETGSFLRGSRNVGFRVKRLVGPPHPSGGGSGVYPSGDRCPGTFRVLGNDSIGKLRLKRGPYRVTLLGKRLSCSAASRLLAGFLDDPDGVLAPPWRLNVQTATFTRGSSRTIGFRIKPAR